MIIMGVDYGDARTGIAVCDKFEMMASGAGCIKSCGFKKTAEAVAKRAAELHAELIVIGNPIWLLLFPIVLNVLYFVLTTL